MSDDIEIEGSETGVSAGERSDNGTPPADPDKAACILVVDDEEDLAALIRQKFRRHIRAGALSFLFAGDGQEALDLIRKHEIDLVLTDVNMPRMDGLTFLAELARRTGGDANPGAVVVTAYGDMVNIRTAMNRGAFDFLTKPIDLDDLELTVDKALERVRERREAAHARDTVGRYLSDEVAETLLAGPEATELGGERRRVTLLMADLRGFSALSEDLPPEQVLDVLNIYLGTMAEVIAEFGGTINDYFGDGMLVLFGAPIERPDHARRAVACAVAMQQAMASVNERVTATGLPELQMGIGINTGDVVVGNIGSERRTKYGVVGSPVNRTSRIESATVGGQVLIAEMTLAEAGSDVEITRMLEIAAKGFSEPITLFEIAGLGGEDGPHLPDEAAPPVPLVRPLPIRYHLLDGKTLEDEAIDADFTSLSTSGGLLRTDRMLEPLANLKLLFPAPTDESLGDAYAKVMEAQGEGWSVRFTALPESVAAMLRNHLASQP